MPTATREGNLHIRTSAEEKAALAEAARLQRQNLSQFVLTTSLAAARELLARQQVIPLSAEAYDAFARRLDEAPRLIPELRAQFDKAQPFRD
jgi:uncharacterized protein (DUF1778 family)